ncbi:hypothetical protein HDV00_003374 [Rhizophlyctis rosea]|nr:hypothetical protein HDV00_003374 [Rhizophlyctis rosea]
MQKLNILSVALVLAVASVSAQDSVPRDLLGGFEGGNTGAGTFGGRVTGVAAFSPWKRQLRCANSVLQLDPSAVRARNGIALQATYAVPLDTAHSPATPAAPTVVHAVPEHRAH